MTEEIAYYEEELTDLLAEVGRGLDALHGKKLSGQARIEKVAEMGNRLQRAKQVLHSYKVEMRDLPRERSGPYDAKAREFHATMQGYHADLTAARNEAERAAVGVKTVDEMSTTEVLQEAGKVQDQSLSAITRMKQNIAASREVGANTAQQLESQTAQLKNIDADIMKVKSNLARGDLLLRAFMRKIATDKIIQVFMLLIFIGVVVIIIWKMVDPDGAEQKGMNGDEVVNPMQQDNRRSLEMLAEVVEGSSSSSSLREGSGSLRRLAAAARQLRR